MRGKVLMFVVYLLRWTPPLPHNGGLYQDRRSNMKDRVPMFRGEERIFNDVVPILRSSDWGRVFVFGAGCPS